MMTLSGSIILSRNFRIAVFRMFLQHDAERVGNFLDCLMKFRFAGIFCFDFSH